jgi:hypothetical protein
MLEKPFTNSMEDHREKQEMGEPEGKRCEAMSVQQFFFHLHILSLFSSNHKTATVPLPDENTHPLKSTSQTTQHLYPSQSSGWADFLSCLR